MEFAMLAPHITPADTGRSQAGRRGLPGA